MNRQDVLRAWVEAGMRPAVAALLTVHAALGCGAEPVGSAGDRLGASTSVRALEIVADGGVSLLVGDSLRLGVRATDSTGAVVAGVRPRWRSLSSQVSVSDAGTVFGVAAGGGRVEAEINQVADTIEVVVQVRDDPPLIAGFNNEPAGMTLVSDEPFTTFPGAWSYQPKQSLARLATDQGAPVDPQVLEFVYPSGFSGGGYSPAAVRPPAPIPDPSGTRNFREVYWGFYFKANAEWQNHQSNVNKILFGWTNNSSTFGLTWHWGTLSLNGRTIAKHLALFQGGSYHNFNTAAAFSIEPGAWHKVELYYRPSSVAGRNDGVLRIWVNDVLCAQHTSLVTTSGYISDLYFDPDWGGVSQVAKARDDYMRIAHARLSVR